MQECDTCSTLPHYFTLPYTDRTQLIPRISVSLWKTVRKKPKELQVRLNKKKIFPQSESSYKKNVFRPLTVKITDEYETQTENSDSPSENKRTKIYEHKTYQSMIENLDAFTTKTEIKDFFWCVENNQQLWMSITNVHCLKDISNSKIYYRFKEVNKRLLQTFFEHKNGILQNQCQITTSPRQLIFGRDIFMSTILQMKSIYKK